MHALSAPELLSLWESALSQPMPSRGLELLARACPECSPPDLACLSIGRRDGLLLALRENMFGPVVEGTSICPKCGESVEIAVPIAQLRVPQPETTSVTLTTREGEYCFRLPRSGDLLAIRGACDLDTGSRMLLELCLLSGPKPVDVLSAENVRAVALSMADADSQANIELAVSCALCGRSWQIGLDILSYLWHEIETWAVRVLRDVHTLAMAYGWRESEILSMSETRRRCYLEMVTA